MNSSDEFREFAQECLRWADETHNEKHRQLFLDLAKQWTLAALKVEGSIAPTRQSLKRTG